MNLKIKWDDSNALQKLIDECYFIDNNGVLRQKETLTISNTDVNFTILKKLKCKVKIVSPLIDGNLTCNKQEFEDRIILKPASIYCIKVNEKYSFY